MNNIHQWQRWCFLFLRNDWRSYFLNDIFCLILLCNKLIDFCCFLHTPLVPYKERFISFDTIFLFLWTNFILHSSCFKKCFHGDKRISCFYGEPKIFERMIFNLNVEKNYGNVRLVYKLMRNLTGLPIK